MHMITLAAKYTDLHANCALAASRSDGICQVMQIAGLGLADVLGFAEMTVCSPLEGSLAK